VSAFHAADQNGGRVNSALFPNRFWNDQDYRRPFKMFKDQSCKSGVLLFNNTLFTAFHNLFHEEQCLEPSDILAEPKGSGVD
jgi:hypothetical protein